MKNRILGITVLLAVLALGLAFVACGPGEDAEVTFINSTGTKVSIVTDGSPANFDLAPTTRATVDDPRQTVTKKGSDLNITSISFSGGGLGLNESNWDQFIELVVSAKPSQKKPKGGFSVGSGSIIFKPLDVYNEHVYDPGENPAVPVKISAIALDE